VLYRGVARLHAVNPSAFKHTLRNGKFFNNGSEGIDCDSEPVDVWRHGSELIKAMREVRAFSLSSGALLSVLGAANFVIASRQNRLGERRNSNSANDSEVCGDAGAILCSE